MIVAVTAAKLNPSKKNASISANGAILNREGRTGNCKRGGQEQRRVSLVLGEIQTILVIKDTSNVILVGPVVERVVVEDRKVLQRTEHFRSSSLKETQTRLTLAYHVLVN